MNRILGVEQTMRLAMKTGPVVSYTTEELLRIAQKCQVEGWQVPRGMSRLESWYGAFIPQKSMGPVQHEDPAIAFIGQPGGKKSGPAGFGEGFGYGGGIGGGRGLGRGRNIGLRRQPDSLDAQGLPLPPENRREAYGGSQMGKFSVRNPAEKGMRLGGEEALKGRDDRRTRRDETEWRRNDKPVSQRGGDPVRRPQWNRQQGDEAAEPAWMDDDTGPLPADPAIAGSSSDPLVQFVPGEDMIAAHKRAMKVKESGGQWRGDKPLVSFFGGDSSIASMPQLESAKPRVFNSADYLLPSKAVEEERDQPEPASGSSAFQSRFQRFFGSGNPTTEIPTSRSADRSPMEVLSPPSHPPSAPPDRPMPPPDDHLGKLMGLLKVSNPSPQDTRPPPGFSTGAGRSPMESRPTPPLQAPSFSQEPRGYPFPPPPPHGGPPRPFFDMPDQYAPPPPDSLRMLMQSQRPGGPLPHGSLPPDAFHQFAQRPPPMMPGARDSPSEYIHPTPGPPGYLPMMNPRSSQPAPPTYGRGYVPFGQPAGPPMHPGSAGPPGPPGPSYPSNAAPPHPAVSPQQPPLNVAQQEMLATLFAGLGGPKPRSS
ncbi:hypothetical protein EHS25_003489 [Saitozyma podzolica]|uniref:Uncharacterized protein n=1 Tax=Saitozyma podzolica TaxID=1890683 RepID=A0A427Y7D6_9TREE|nr:hypothetical protein EHS25_003489 [Saitozyma podzolica]